MDSEIPSFEAQQQRVKLDRKSTIFPAQPSQVRRCKLSPFDLRFLSHHYNQRCLHYPKPTIDFQTLVDLLKKSLSENLVYFYPLAGRLASSTTDGVYVDCNDSGVEFVEASAQHLGLEDILNPEIPAFIGQLFPLDGAIDVQGQTLPLLAVQVTKLRNGVSVALTVNHCIVDGHSLWHFIDSWTQICRNGSPTISLLPTHDRFGTETSVNMDLVSFQKGLHKPLPPPLRVKVFQFSRDMICRLKDRANEDSKDKPISSFQALCAHTWQAFIRARRPPANVATTLILSVDCRRRLVPPLPPSYFGNVVGAAHGRTYVGELLGNKLSFAARLVHECIRGFQDGNVRDMVDPSESSKRKFEFGDNDLLVSGSPRFGMYESDFGWGRSVGRSIGLINRVDGLIYADPGEDGEGSVALEIALLPHCMNLLEIDEQFLLQSI